MKYQISKHKFYDELAQVCRSTCFQRTWTERDKILENWLICLLTFELLPSAANMIPPSYLTEMMVVYENEIEL